MQFLRCSGWYLGGYLLDFIFQTHFKWISNWWLIYIKRYTNLWHALRFSIQPLRGFQRSSLRDFSVIFLAQEKRNLIWQSKRKIPAHIYLYFIQNFHRAGETMQDTAEVLKGFTLMRFLLCRSRGQGIRIRCLMRDAPWCVKQRAQRTFQIPADKHFHEGRLCMWRSQ